MANGYTQVETLYNLVHLDDTRMTPLWEALAALDVPLYIHPGASPVREEVRRGMSFQIGQDLGTRHPSTRHEKASFPR